MTVCQYCTPEWLETNARLAESNPQITSAFAKLVTKTCFRVKADKAWGIEEDIIFGAYVDKGKITRLSFISKEQANAEADYIMAATPQEWKKILRKENKFVADFMLGRITLDKGSKAGVMTIAPYSSKFVEALTQTELQFPDEMSPDELTHYRAHIQEFRTRLAV